MLSEHKNSKHIVIPLFRTLFVAVLLRNGSQADLLGAVASHHDRTGIVESWRFLGTAHTLRVPTSDSTLDVQSTTFICLSMSSQ
jgi:F0F1-type ATP synthase membrane subunit a